MEQLLGDLLKLIGNTGPVQWDLARQLAQVVASDGEAQGNVDPVERIRLEELVRIADLHVSDATGLSTSVGGVIRARPVTRGEWASSTIRAWQPLLESLAGALAPPPAGTADPPLSDPEVAGFAGLLGSLGQALGPAILGMQVGSAVGHLARRAMGPYPLPIPRPPADELQLVPASMAQFAEDWSLPIDEVRLWVCLDELTHHAVLSRPHVRDRLGELLGGYVGGFQPDTAALEERLAQVDPADLPSFQAALGDPTALLGQLQTPAQRQLLAQIEAVVVALEGWVDHVMDTVGHRLIHSYPALTEALRRRRVERGESDRLVEQLFGLELTESSFDRGTRFTQGVLERAGEDGLRRLWASSETLPTPAEVDAPGLWLARIDLGRTGPDQQP